MTAVVRAAIALAAGIVVILAAVSTGVHPMPAARDETVPFARGPFAEGAYTVGSDGLPRGIKARGSAVGGDAFQGSFVTGWYAPARDVGIMVAGSPRQDASSLKIEARIAGGAAVSIPFDLPDPHESWRLWGVALPRGATTFRIVAIDGSSNWRGWLAVSEPFAPRWSLAPSQAARSLLAFAVVGLLYAASGLAVARFLPRRLDIESWLVPIVAMAGVAALAYVAFWAYFSGPLLGRVFSWLWAGGTIAALVGSARFREQPRSSPVHGGCRRVPEWPSILGIAIAFGAGAIALTCLYGGGPFSKLAASRFQGLPIDNQLPAMFADRLWHGQSPRMLFGDWLSSDRPPLQTGWILLTRPMLDALGFDADTAAMASSVCFQLLWVPAIWAFARRLGAGRGRASAVAAALAFGSFFLLYTVFTWPKLGGASLVLAGFLLWWTRPFTTARFACGGACTALGWLGHAGVSFSLLGLAPLMVVSLARRRQTIASWISAAAVFLAFAVPWLAYQKFYEPPGDRLLKYHLAGFHDVDARGLLRTLEDQYRRIGWHGALENRLANLRLQWAGDWRSMFTLRVGAVLEQSRRDQFALTGSAFGWWLPVLVLLPWVLWRRRRQSDDIMPWAAAWMVLGWLVWIAMMYEPNTAVNHAGSNLTQLLGYTLLAWSALAANRAMFLVLAAGEAALFWETWVPNAPNLSGGLDPLAAWVAIASGAILAAMVVKGSASEGGAT